MKRKNLKELEETILPFKKKKLRFDPCLSIFSCNWVCKYKGLKVNMEE